MQVLVRPGITLSLGRKIMSGEPSIIFKSQLHGLKRIAQNPLPPPACPCRIVSKCRAFRALRLCRAERSKDIVIVYRRGCGMMRYGIWGEIVIFVFGAFIRGI